MLVIFCKNGTLSARDIFIKKKYVNIGNIGSAIKYMKYNRLFYNIKIY